MKNKKYCIVLIFLSLFLTISMISIDRNIDSRLTNDKIHLSSNPMQQALFKFGTMYGPVDLDPQVAWDSASIDVIDQVCEGLFAYDLTDPSLALIPNLALSGTWNPGATEFTVILRQGVKFHDGADFDADAVIFTWDRMSWALNTTGTNTDSITQVAQLYEFPDGTPIVSSITRNGDYNVTFNLARPYVPFQSLLCFSASYILSPDSTPATAYIDTATGDIVGTGPFVYDEYEAGVEVNFHAFNNYWRGKANITEMTFKIITDANDRNAALLSGDIHFLQDPLPSLYSAFESSPDITFLNTSTTSGVTQYLGMNNQQINTTWREAIAYAIDYDYIVDVLREGDAAKMESPIPEGILYANWTFDEAVTDIPYAREVMQSMGYGSAWNVTVDSADEMLWQNAVFFSVNYTYNIGNNFREDVLVLLQDNLGKIGIVVEDAGMTWGEFIYRLYEIGSLHRNMLQLYWIGWGPDYNDPSNFINPLFTNRSVESNGAQYNGYLSAIEAGRNPMLLNDNVQLLMEAGLSETNPVAREAIYDRIQELLIEHDRPWAWGYVSYVYHAYDQHLTGFQQNVIKKIYFYPCVWNYTIPILPGLFSILSDAGDPDFDGNFNITWSPSAYADNYSLYVYSSLITEINGSLTLLLDESTDLSYEANGYSDGTYYFLVVAKNGNDNTTSSNLIVNIEISELPSPFTLFSDAGSPDANGDFNLGWTPSTFVKNYSLYVYSSLITEINGSLTLLLDEVTVTSYEALDYSDGTYFFAVVAKNIVGTTFSNNLEVIVEILGLPSPFTLSSDAGSPDSNGDFNLIWTPSTLAENYSLYVYSSLITEINGSLTLLLDEVTDLSYEALDYSDGTYFFAVVAKNTVGTRLSNNLEVVVEIYNLPSPFTLFSDAGSPDSNGIFNLAWISSTYADNYSLYVYSSLITEINGSLTLLLNEVTVTSYEAIDYSDGTYFFVVVAKNAYGTTLSNNLEVIVEMEEPEPEPEPEPDPEIPGFEMWTMFFTISSVSLILLLRKKKKIT